MDATDITHLQETLEAALPDQIWLRLLETFVPSGVADGLQLRQATGCERDKLRRILEKIDSHIVGFPPVIRMLDHTITRAGTRGRSPNVYLLGESGAALLQANGHPDVRPCELHDDHAIAHALVMLSIHLLAAQAGLNISTDKYLKYGSGRHLRPDHVVILPDDHRILFEVEQAAERKLIPRILDSLENKQDFFQSEECQSFVPEVRMLVNVPLGREWHRTMKVWAESCNLILQKRTEPLAFRLLAMPLTEFLNIPEWDIQPSSRWRHISASFLNQDKVESGLSDLDTISRSIEANRSALNDCILLSALAQQFNEEKGSRPSLKADPHFFDLVQTIYSASYQETQDLLKAVSLPIGSIYLLRRYLEMHPSLLKKLQRTMHHGKGRIHWNTAMVIHRMQQVVNQFVAYHGWTTNGLLRVEAVYGNWSGVGPFGIKAEKVGFWEGGNNYSENWRAIESLCWVLWALFEYAEDIGLGRPEFW
jgi:hypothetical protein